MSVLDIQMWCDYDCVLARLGETRQMKDYKTESNVTATLASAVIMAVWSGLLLGLASVNAADTGENRRGVELLSRRWQFTTARRAWSCLDAQTPQASFFAPTQEQGCFTVKMVVDLKTFDQEKQILNIPNVLNVHLREHDPLDRTRQNYPAFKMPDGSVPVLEATMALHSVEHPDWTHMTIGIPVAMLDTPQGEHELVLNFSGVHWTMYVDGELLDNDFPFGYARWQDTNPWELDPAHVKQAMIFFPGIVPDRVEASTPRMASDIQYWLPREHNNWVGDVATIFHEGRYHVFYLYDRRHHQSKFGCGAHYFEHLSTTDFRTWTEHEAATPLEEQWECIGTGVPFVFQNRLHISYGLHTTRVYAREKTTLPVQWAYLNEHGVTGSFKSDTTPGVPAGSTYAVSTDNLSCFVKSQVMFHPCENPSVYTDPGGRLRMMANYGAKGIWASESVDGAWHCISPDFPPGGDCTFFFRWGRYDYIIGGFTGLWSKPADAPDSAYEDLVGQGLDFYDGSNVPSISEIGHGRFLMAAWIPIRGWGGNLIIRELIQFPNGRIGSKWMSEITPTTSKPMMLAPSIAHTSTFPLDHSSFMLTFSVQPTQAGKGKLGITFLPEDGDRAACELQIGLDHQRAQFGPGTLTAFAAQQKSLREGESPHQARHYAIENLMNVDRPFTVRMIVKTNDKIGGSLIDAEIAGHRTMISYCPELAVKKIICRIQEVELKDVRIAPMSLGIE